MTIAQIFPLLNDENHEITSPVTTDYNCIAWGFKDQERWWEPAPGYYWPEQAKQSYELEPLVDWLISEGFSEASNTAYDKDFEKIAVYGADGDYTHIARLLPSGKWASKIGDLEDIEHKSIGSLEGRLYGQVAFVMERRVKAKR